MTHVYDESNETKRKEKARQINHDTKMGVLESLEQNELFSDYKPVTHIHDKSNENKSKQKALHINHDTRVVVTDEDGEDKHPGERWSHLWVPNYRPDIGYFSQWDTIKKYPMRIWIYGN